MSGFDVFSALERAAEMIDVSFGFFHGFFRFSRLCFIDGDRTVLMVSQSLYQEAQRFALQVTAAAHG